MKNKERKKGLFRTKTRNLVLGFAVFLILLGLFWVKIRSMIDSDGGLPLEIKWEGLVNDKNHRDVFGSVNECLGEKLFKEAVLYRSNVWFSGWDCKTVSNPEVIFSLNYSPEKSERYFCRNKSGNLVGKFYNFDLQFDDLERFENWQDPKIGNYLCQFVDNILSAIIAKKRVLIHCNAGRDRTGVFSGLMVALTAEVKGQLNDKVLTAIECDYRKTKSLSQDYYGSLERLFRTFKAQGGISPFLQKNCKIDHEKIVTASNSLFLE